MEFKEFGPLEQSKQSAENKKSGWASVIVLIGFAFAAGILYSKKITQHYWENENKMRK